MKKTYLAKRNALFSSTNISWGVYALVVAVFALLMRLIVPNFFLYLFTPVFRVSDTFSEGSHILFNSFRDTAELALENERLVNENMALALQNQAFIEKENSLSGLGHDNKKIIAGVVARPPLSPYDTFILASGSDDGVTLGMEAFGDGNTPLGVVSSVLANFSRVTLFSAPGASTVGWVGKANLSITLSGIGAGAMRASVARSAGVVVGDIVSVPGPGMLPIGTVVRVDSDSTSPSVILRIMPALNLFSVAWVALRDTGSVSRGMFSSTTPMLP